jgi:hypothetical protein
MAYTYEPQDNLNDANLAIFGGYTDEGFSD